MHYAKIFIRDLIWRHEYLPVLLENVTKLYLSSLLLNVENYFKWLVKIFCQSFIEAVPCCNVSFDSLVYLSKNIHLQYCCWWVISVAMYYSSVFFVKATYHLKILYLGYKCWFISAHCWPSSFIWFPPILDAIQQSLLCIDMLLLQEYNRVSPWFFTY